MPVIINDFEIIAEPPPAPPEANSGQPAGPPPEPPALHPEDILRIAHHEQQRLERLRAD